MSLETNSATLAYTGQCSDVLASSQGVHDFYMSQQKALKRAFDMVIW